MEKKRKSKSRELLVYGETLNTSHKIHREASLFMKWFTEQGHSHPNLRLDRALKLFAETRPWGKKIYSYASDIKAVKYAFLTIFDNPDSLYPKEIIETPEGARLKLYQEMYEEYCKDPSRRPVSPFFGKGRYTNTVEEFIEAIEKQIVWNDTHGKEWEKLKSTAFTAKQFNKFLKDAAPKFKELKKTFGTRICEAFDCMNLLPDKRRKEMKYCSEKCKNNAKQKRWSDSHIVEKKLRRK